MTDTTTPPVTEPAAEPVNLPRAWPWVAGVAALVVLCGGIAAATAGGEEDGPTRQLCHALANSLASPYMTPSEGKVEARIVEMYRDRYPSAPLPLRNAATGLATTYKYWDGTPADMRQAAFYLDQLAELCD